MSQFSQHLQDCIIHLLIVDTDFVKQVRPEIKPEYFTSHVTMSLCELVFRYFDTFKEAPKDHFFEELEVLFKNRKMEEVEKERYEMYLGKIFQIDPNKEYVLSQIHTFVRRSTYIQFISEFADLAKKDRLDEMEALMYKTLKVGIPQTVRGVDYFRDTSGLVSRIEETQYLMYTGIPRLDDFIKGFKRKQYILIMAPEKGMKSWFLVHLGAQAMLQGLKVVHFTHEMPSDEVEMRYDQNLMALPLYSKGKYTIRYLDQYGKDQIEKRIIDKSVYSIDHVIKKRREIRRFGGDLKIVEYPTGIGTPMKMENDLDRLESTENYHADIVISDYSGIMSTDEHIPEERHKINRLCTRLRGIAGERNILVLDGYQASKVAQDKSGFASNVLAKHAQEDKRVIGICDLCLTISASESEWKNHVARIGVGASRKVRGRKQVSIVYSLDTGQFVAYERKG
jgi:replicative DNA helicase